MKMIIFDKTMFDNQQITVKNNFDAVALYEIL